MASRLENAMKKQDWSPRRRMSPLELPKRIASREDLIQFFAFLDLVDRTSFHPDDRFYDPASGEVQYTASDGSPAYSAGEAKRRDRLMSQAWAFSDREGLDIYEVALWVSGAINGPGHQNEDEAPRWVVEAVRPWV